MDGVYEGTKVGTGDGTTERVGAFDASTGLPVGSNVGDRVSIVEGTADGCPVDGRKVGGELRATGAIDGDRLSEGLVVGAPKISSIARSVCEQNTISVSWLSVESSSGM